MIFFKNNGNRKIVTVFVIIIIFSFFSCADTQDNIDRCFPNPCKNDSMCINLTDSYKCKCGSGYSGDNCEVDIDECEPNPCIHGTCRDEVDSYSCSCDAGYRGLNCEENVDDCSSNPCIHGVCSDGIDSYQCECEMGYQGLNCDVKIANCSDNNGGCEQNCKEVEEEIECSCNSGYVLNDDNITCDDIDECSGDSPNGCFENEYCINSVGSYSCEPCNCNLDGSISSACDENGLCSCKATFIGEKCETEKHLKIFVTESGYSGNLGGVEGADMKCNADIMKPDSGYYKALIGADSRDILIDDWILLPNTSYYRSDDMTLITITNRRGWFDFPFDSSISEFENRVWTGLRDDGTAAVDNSCSNWLRSSYASGKYGISSALFKTAIKADNNTCDKYHPLYCVEQICPSGKQYDLSSKLCIDVDISDEQN